MIIGLLVDVGGSFVAGVVRTILYVASFADGTTNEDQMAAALTLGARWRAARDLQE